jgi:peptidoglycan/xylan/chitin deacetylase (PgdA/CDA1 family)
VSTAAPALRWYSKKAARACVALSADGLRRMSNRRDVAGVVRAVTYHRFGDAARDPFCVDIATFALHMEWLAERNLAISLADLDAFIAGERTLADGSVLVTIDDGCPSVVSRALPVLQRFDIPAIVFVPAGEMREIGTAGNGTDESPEARISWSELARLAGAGVEVGSHSWTHASLMRMTRSEAREQLIRSREEIERRLGKPVIAFAYPFGTRADYDDVLAAELPRAGYRLAFTSRHGAIASGAERFTLPRIKIEGGERSWMFRLATAGALDGWRVVDQALWRLQASRE